MVSNAIGLSMSRGRRHPLSARPALEGRARPPLPDWAVTIPDHRHNRHPPLGGLVPGAENGRLAMDRYRNACRRSTGLDALVAYGTGQPRSWTGASVTRRAPDRRSPAAERINPVPGSGESRIFAAPVDHRARGGVEQQSVGQIPCLSTVGEAPPVMGERSPRRGMWLTG